MKTLLDYIIEHNDNYNLSDSIDYEKYTELLLYINNSTIFIDRLQAICDTFRHDYFSNLTSEKLINSKIFKKFIDDSIAEYNKDYNTQLDINLGTKIRLTTEVASLMLPKIKLELEKIEINDDESE